MSNGRRFIRRLFRKNRAPDEVMLEAVDDGVHEDGMYENLQLENRPTLPDSGSPKGDWDNQSPTEKQLRYIKVLGGDPLHMGTKREASDRINSLLRMRGRWPLDPDLLQQRGARASAESDGAWRSAHHSLLASLRLDLQNYVDLSLSNLRNKLSDPLGPAGSSQSWGPKELVHRAEQELKQLELCRKCGQPLDSLSLKGIGNAEPDDAPKQTYSGDDDSKIHGTDWLGLIAVFAGCVTLEAAANIGLLMAALPGGALSAFLLAVLISMINVGGFGISLGLLLFALRRHFGSRRSRLYQAVWGAWMLSVLAFNLVAGRHREAYARVLHEIEEDPTAPVPAPRDMLPDIPFNPLAWELEALLFALLGIFLCTLGFAKGFTFRRGKAELQGDDNRRQGKSGEADAVTEATPPITRQLFNAFLSLPQRYQGSLTDLRGEIANWYRALDQERRNVTTLLERLKVKENRLACIDNVEHGFIVAHNKNYPDKIDLQCVEAHRLEKYSEPLAVTASDPQVLDEAGALVSEWKESGKAGFDKEIAAAYEEITVIWNNYKPLCLDEPERIAANGKVAPPATGRS